MAHEAYGLGTNELTAPQGEMFATLVDGLLLQEALPWSPILLGLLVGIVAVGMDVIAGKRGLQLPAMALAVGIYLPAYLGIGILIGSMCRYFGERARERETGKRERTNEGILAAAGLITGAAALDLLLGVGVLFGFDLGSLQVFSTTGAEGMLGITGTLMTIHALGGIAFLGWILYRNSRSGTTGETGS